MTVCHCHAAARVLREAMQNASMASQSQDPNSTIEGNMNQTAAMFSHWCKLFDVPVDFDAELRCSPRHKPIMR